METLLWVRVTAIVLALVFITLAMYRREAVVRTVRTFFSEPQSASSLGLLRVFIFAILLWNALERRSTWYATLPDEFRQLPFGWEWAENVIPLSIETTRRLEWTLIVSSLAAMLGIFTRPACIVASLSGLYVFGMSSAFYFKIGHGLHVPLLSAMILAASPAGDAVSLDELYRRLRGAPPRPVCLAYALPVRFCWLLLGTMYLFPGLWKVWENGDQWLDGTRLQAALISKWIDRPEYRPTIRPDRIPLVLPLLGVGTLFIEVAVFFLLFARKTRVLAGLLASSFHVGIALVTDIVFNPLHPLIVLLDFPYLLRGPRVSRVIAPLTTAWAKVEAWFEARRRRAGRTDRAPVRSARAATVIGSFLVVAMIAAGSFGISSWPISVYPRFAQRMTRDRTMTRGIAFMVVGVDGKEREVNPSFYPLEDSSAHSIVARRLRKEVRRGRADGLYVTLVARLVRENCGPFPEGERLRIYDFSFASDPDERDGKKHDFTLVVETRL